jgi:hypothetical protein
VELPRGYPKRPCWLETYQARSLAETLEINTWRKICMSEINGYKKLIFFIIVLQIITLAAVAWHIIGSLELGITYDGDRNQYKETMNEYADS